MIILSPQNRQKQTMAKTRTSFKKGQSGNPGGRPKMPWTFMGLYKEELEQILTTKDGKQIEAKRAVAKRLVQMAIEGDIQAIRELGNRVEGMPKQSLEHSGEISLPTPIYGGKSKV